GFHCKVPELLQLAEEVSLMAPELPHQGRSLVLEQISALADEGLLATTVEQLAAGGDKGLHGRLQGLTGYL
ncbi:MAG: hypothetical protein ACRDGH_17355, partial [Candidatus Limnocylindria bacterium]